MGLDRWIKPDKKREKEEAETTLLIKNSSVKTKTVKSEEKPKIELIKYLLICPKAKCKYQRILMKKRITEKDKLCPRCKTEMKIQTK